MPDINAIDPRYRYLDGVEMREPPIELVPSLTDKIRQAMAVLGEQEQGALVWVADTKGVNLAVVQRLDSHVEVLGWIGKKWGQPLAAGIVGRVHW